MIGSRPAMSDTTRVTAYRRIRADLIRWCFLTLEKAHPDVFTSCRRSDDGVLTDSQESGFQNTVIL